MALSAGDKAKVIATHQRVPKDTGSSEVQIALLSADIDYLTKHFQAHPKDKHSRRGLMHRVNRRRKLLDYLKRTDNQCYLKLIGSLGLRR